MASHITAEKRAEIESLLRKGLSINETARQSGCTWFTCKTVQQSLAMPTQVLDSGLEVPILTRGEPSTEEIISRLRADSIRREAAKTQGYRIRVGVPDDKPFVLAFVGDPHLESQHTDWDLLEHDLELLRKAGVYSINIGDTTDNWGDKLVRLYADQRATKADGRRLARWFLKESGVSWLLWLFGNHDAWNDWSSIFREENTTGVPMVDWIARVTLVLENGLEINLTCAHDFPGSSMWNKLHANVRAAIMHGDSDVYVAGHRHIWGLHQGELENGRGFIALRSRGYKGSDEHSVRHGFSSQKFGATTAIVVDPTASSAMEALTPFRDLSAAVKFAGL
jgi:hypothetical protein